jgi:hypothetical protein
VRGAVVGGTEKAALRAWDHGALPSLPLGDGGPGGADVIRLINTRRGVCFSIHRFDLQHSEQQRVALAGPAGPTASQNMMRMKRCPWDKIHYHGTCKDLSFIIFTGLVMTSAEFAWTCPGLMMTHTNHMIST